MNIVHVVNTYVPKNPDEQARLARAASTWKHGFLREVPTEVLRRTSDKVMNDTRRLPFIKDLVEYILGWSFPEQVRDVLHLPDTPMVKTIRDSECLIMLTNTDTCLCSNVTQILLDEVNVQLMYSHRRNFTRFPKRILSSAEIAERGDEFKGVDMVAFTPAWWRENRDKFPDLVLGCEGWDWVFKYWPGAKQLPDCVYHEYHYPPYWMANRQCPAEIWNKRRVWEWAKDRSDLSELMVDWPTLEEYAQA
jgi:hypothetical protein